MGGQTGDCAGAVQQLSEVVFYLSAIALWKFI
ncbi:adenosylcobinamide-GDP ribazoletransferase [Thalassobellus suaedae]